MQSACHSAVAAIMATSSGTKAAAGAEDHGRYLVLVWAGNAVGGEDAVKFSATPIFPACMVEAKLSEVATPVPDVLRVQGVEDVRARSLVGLADAVAQGRRSRDRFRRAGRKATGL